MKIDFKDYDLTGFKQVPCEFAGVDCVLIYPEDITIKFTDKNKIFRSSIWTTDSELVSPGYRKFVNYGEQPLFEPLNENEKGLTFSEKIDGSCCIVSKFRGQLIIRTRQTVDARLMKNGHEIDTLIKKYPKAFDNAWVNNGFSCIYEWTTPENIIVLRYSNEPELWLTGIIDHIDYHYVQQCYVDEHAKYLEVKRGTTYKFDSFEEMKETVLALDNKEGVVVYSADGQTLKKVKSLRYLYLHKMKSKLNSFETLVEFFLSYKCTDEQSFIDALTGNLDFEIALSVKGDAIRVISAFRYAESVICNTRWFIESIKDLPTRKDQALAIMKYDKVHSWLAFGMLDNKPIDNVSYKKLMMEEGK